MTTNRTYASTIDAPARRTGPKSAHLSLVPPVPTFQPYDVEPTTPWWVEPSWCAGDCVGGSTHYRAPDRPGLVDCRLHERTAYETHAVDDIDGGDVKVQVRLERADACGDLVPVPTDVVLRFTGEGPSDQFGVRLSRAQRRELAAALLNADDLDDTAVTP